ncbi:ABC transporter substrate-binding protein [Niveibacterium sp. SC-1]|uniref:substrate-binding periplasmic protein n=1 Tax=Niveibacterium sp. SC-1 TaxID=3135646 RepID=UPI00311FDD59
MSLQTLRHAGPPVFPSSCARLLMAGGVLLACAGVQAGEESRDGTVSRLARVTAEHVLNVCIWPQYYGVSFRNPKSGAITGVDVDMARAFAAELGAELRFVDTNFLRVDSDLKEARCDVAMTGLAVTPEREARMDFTRPHLRSDVYAVTTLNSRRVRRWEDIDRPGIRVAVQAGTYHEPLMRERLRQAELVVINPPQTREGELEAGRVDVFMSDYPFTRKMQDNHDWVRVIAPPSSYRPTNYAYAVRPGDRAWLQRVDAFVAAIKADGRLRVAARRYGLEPIVLEK